MWEILKLTSLPKIPLSGIARLFPKPDLYQMNEISVCIVDDNKQLRSALEEIITMSDGYKCVATIGTAEEAIQNIPSIKPDVVLMDINLGSVESGIDCVRILKPLVPDTNFMMCTVYEEDEKIFEALSAGASGYILKKTAPGRLPRSHPRTVPGRRTHEQPDRPQSSGGFSKQTSFCRNQRTA
ncbi:MAG: response regulator transcription factor [Bacteroidota bacterium]